MSAVGYAILPVTLSMAGVGEQLKKELGGSAQKAAKAAGESIEKGIGDAARNAAKDVERAQKLQEGAAKKVSKAEEAVTKAKQATSDAVSALEATELKREEVAVKGAQRIRDAEQKYDRVLNDSKSTAEQVEKAESELQAARLRGQSEAVTQENRVEQARRKVQDSTKKAEDAEKELRNARSRAEQATENLAAANTRLDRAQDDSGKSAKDLKKSLGQVADEGSEAEGVLDKLSGSAGKVAGALAGALGVAGLGSMAMDFAGEAGKINRQLGLTGDEATAMTDEIQELMKTGVAGSSEEAAQAVGSLKSAFQDMDTGSISELSGQVLAVSTTFDMDLDELTQTMKQTMRAGLADSADEALDLMVGSFQKVPAAMREEIPELMNEYGTFFNSLGYSGEEAFGVLVSASDQGKIAMDKVGDALKEAGIRATDIGDTAAVEALESIGLAGEDVQNRLLAGGETARTAFQQIITELQGVKDPAAQAEAAVALIGTPLEDLNKAELDGFLNSLSGADEALGETTGKAKELSDAAGSSLPARMNALKGTVTSLASDAFMFLWDVISEDVIPALESMGGWIQDNKSWLGPMASILGGVAVALGGYSLAVSAAAGATALATGALTGLRTAMTFIAAHPILLAIGAVAGALVWFFTQTEMGQEMLGRIVEGLKTMGSWVVDIAKGIGQGASDIWNSITGFFGGIPGFFSGIWDGVKGGWSTFTEWLGGLGGTALEKLSGIKDAFNAIPGWIQGVVGSVGQKMIDLTDKMYSPINWVIKNLINEGLIDSYNKVAGTLKLPKMGYIPEIKVPDFIRNAVAFSTGGIYRNVIPGYSPGVDDHLFVNPLTGAAIAMGGGEAILRPEVTSVLGSGWVNQVNQAAIRGGMPGVRKLLEGGVKTGRQSSSVSLPARTTRRFNTGGTIGSIGSLLEDRSRRSSTNSGTIVLEGDSFNKDQVKELVGMISNLEVRQKDLNKDLVGTIALVDEATMSLRRLDSMTARTARSHQKRRK